MAVQQRLFATMLVAAMPWQVQAVLPQSQNSAVTDSACFTANVSDDALATVFNEELSPKAGSSDARDLSLLQMAASKALQNDTESWDTCASMKSCNEYKPGSPCQCTGKCGQHKNCCSDYAATCTAQKPSVPRSGNLHGSPSSAPLHTFYMYRAQSDSNFEPLNANTASLGGVLWYLQNEIVPYCRSKTRGGAPGYRKFKKTRIIRYKVTTKATTPLYEKGMNFGVRMAFDSGRNTGAWYPERDTGNLAYAKYGYNVGCNKLGEGPYPLCPSPESQTEGFCPILYGDDAAWYSLPGPCVSANFWTKNAQCKHDEPGGYCKGTPTGAGDCTWTYESAGEVNLDELSGISGRFRSHSEFCRRGCIEYEKFSRRKGKDKGRCGVHFWDHRMDAGKNQWRMKKLDQAFKSRYPNMPSDSQMPAPRCDFNKAKYYEGL